MPAAERRALRRRTRSVRGGAHDIPRMQEMVKSKLWTPRKSALSCRILPTAARKLCRRGAHRSGQPFMLHAPYLFISFPRFVSIAASSPPSFVPPPSFSFFIFNRVARSSAPTACVCVCVFLFVDLSSKYECSRSVRGNGKPHESRLKAGFVGR